jgi:N-acetylmuramic acid 6-phosphate etherase
MKTTESESHYHDLDKMSTDELLRNINREDSKVAAAVYEAIPQIEQLVDVIADRCWQVAGSSIWVPAPVAGSVW